MRIGVISDTHGWLRPEALRELEDCELIVHAGDIGGEEVLQELERIAPVVAVRGNVDVDTGHAMRPLPTFDVTECAGQTLYIVHRLADMDIDPHAAGVAAVIHGHSHQPLTEWRNGVLYFNPGSAGPQRLPLPVTVGRLTLDADGRLKPQIIHLT